MQAAFAAQVAAQQSGGGGGASGPSDMKKYERMKKMGLPINSIINRMKMDGIAADGISKFCGSSMPKAANATEDDEKQIMTEYRASTKLKPFHWAKMNQHSTDSTVWCDVEKDIPAICKQINFEVIAKAFSKDADKEQKQKDAEKRKKKKKENQLIDPKRAQNVMIGLAQIKLSEDALLDAILQLDDTKLPPDKLRKLLPYVPTDGELQMVRDYVKNGGNVNELSKVEQFFVKMMDMVGIRERISLWLFKSEFPSILGNVSQRITYVSETMDKLVGSQKLKKVLYIVLAVGNYLNGTSSRGNAFGFHMEPTLDLLSGTKSVGKDSLTLHVLQIIQEIDPSLEGWVEELDVLDISWKIQTNSLLTDLDAMKRDMSSIDKHLKVQRRTMTKMASDWARDGAAVNIHQIARHIRKLSKQGSEAMFNGCETYSGLRVGMGVPGKIKPNFAAADAAAEKDEPEETENVFSKVMLIFYKKSNSKLTEVETLMKKTQQSCKKMNSFFGFEENKKWEDVLCVFYNFKEQFQKAQRELNVRKEKENRKKNQNEKQKMLSDKLKKRPTKEEVANKVKSVNLDDMDSKDDGKGGSGAGGGSGKAKSMYADYMKKKKTSQAAANKKVWV